MFYTAAYAAMNVGAFVVVSHFANVGEKYVTLEDYAGLGQTIARARRHLHLLSDVADRHSDHRRLLRQVLCAERGPEVGPRRIVASFSC